MNRMALLNVCCAFICAELVRAMNHVINQGWVMYWGTARWSPSEVFLYKYTLLHYAIGR